MPRTSTTPALPETVGQRIRAAREQLGLSQHQLAERSQLATRTVIYAEQGRAGTRLSTVEAIADGLGLPIEELVAD